MVLALLPLHLRLPPPVTQLDLFAELEAPRCPLCGCMARLHLPLHLINDRRGCRAFT
jgi:hypothetical protein